MIIGVRIRKVIVNGDSRSVRYANGGDPQSVGLPNVVIRRQVVSGRGPQSVRYANGVTHSQWVRRTL